MAKSQGLLYKFAKYWFGLRRQRPVAAYLLTLIPITWPAWLLRKAAFQDEIITHVTTLCERAVELKSSEGRHSSAYRNILFQLRSEFMLHGPMIHAFINSDITRQTIKYQVNTLLTLLSGPLLYELYPDSDKGIAVFEWIYRDKLAILPPSAIASLPGYDVGRYERNHQDECKHEEDNSVAALHKANIPLEMPGGNIVSYDGWLKYVESDAEWGEKAKFGLKLIKRHLPGSSQGDFTVKAQTLLQNMMRNKQAKLGTQTEYSQLSFTSKFLYGTFLFLVGQNNIESIIRLIQIRIQGLGETASWASAFYNGIHQRLFAVHQCKRDELNLQYRENQLRRQFYEIIQKPYIKHKRASISPKSVHESRNIPNTAKLVQVSVQAAEEHKGVPLQHKQVFNLEVGMQAQVQSSQEKKTCVGQETRTNVALKRKRQTSNNNSGAVKLNLRNKQFVGLDEFYNSLVKLIAGDDPQLMKFLARVGPVRLKFKRGFPERLYALVQNIRRLAKGKEVVMERDAIRIILESAEKYIGNKKSFDLDVLQHHGIVLLEHDGKIKLCYEKSRDKYLCVGYGSDTEKHLSHTEFMLTGAQYGEISEQARQYLESHGQSLKAFENDTVFQKYVNRNLSKLYDEYKSCQFDFSSGHLEMITNLVKLSTVNIGAPILVLLETLQHEEPTKCKAVLNLLEAFYKIDLKAFCTWSRLDWIERVLDLEIMSSGCTSSHSENADGSLRSRIEPMPMILHKLCVALSKLKVDEANSILARTSQLSDVERKWFLICVACVADASDINGLVDSILDIIKGFKQIGVPLPVSVPSSMIDLVIRYDGQVICSLSRMLELIVKVRDRYGDEAEAIQKKFMQCMPINSPSALHFLGDGGKFVHNAMLLSREGNAMICQLVFPGEDEIGDCVEAETKGLEGGKIGLVIDECNVSSFQEVSWRCDFVDSVNASDPARLELFLRDIKLEDLDVIPFRMPTGSTQSENRTKKWYSTFYAYQALFLRFVASNFKIEDVQALLELWEKETGSDLTMYGASVNIMAGDGFYDLKFDEIIWRKIKQKMLELKAKQSLKFADPIFQQLQGGLQFHGESLQEVKHASREEHSFGEYAKPDIEELLLKITAPSFVRQFWRQQLLTLNKCKRAITSNPAIITADDLRSIMDGLKLLFATKDNVAESKHENSPLAPSRQKALVLLDKLAMSSTDDLTISNLTDLLAMIKSLKAEDKQSVGHEEKVPQSSSLDLSKLSANISQHNEKLTQTLHLLGLAILREACFEETDPSIWLRPEQVIVILQALSGVDTSFEVKTGEGKTLVSAVIALLSAVSGNKVRYTTSNNILAKDAEAEARIYAKYCGLSVGFLEAPTAVAQSTDVLFTTTQTAAMSARMHTFAKSFDPNNRSLGTEDTRPCHFIHDESDETFVNNAKTAMVGTEGREASMHESKPFISFLETIARYHNKPKSESLEALLANNGYYKALDPSEQTSVLQHWRAAFRAADKYQADIDFIISKPDNKGRRYIQLINIETGVILPNNCYLRSGLHSALAIRERLGLKPSSQGKASVPRRGKSTVTPRVAGATSVKREFSPSERATISLPSETETLYQTSASALQRAGHRVTALTGTSGVGTSKHEVLKSQLCPHRLLAHVIMPVAKRPFTRDFHQWTQIATDPAGESGEPAYQTHYSRRFIQNPIFVQDQEEYFATLYQAIKLAQKNDQELDGDPADAFTREMPPILVIFKTIKEVEQFYQYCKNKGLKDIVVYDGIFPEESKQDKAGARLPEVMVREKSKRGHVVLGTFLAGRGVDFKKLRYAFIPHGLEDSMLQSASRAARNMDKGMVTPIINLEALAYDMGKIGLKYDSLLGPEYNFKYYQVALQQQDLHNIINARRYNEVLDHLQNSFFSEIERYLESKPNCKDELKQTWSRLFSKISQRSPAEFSDLRQTCKVVEEDALGEFKKYQSVHLEACRGFEKMQLKARDMQALKLAATDYCKRVSAADPIFTMQDYVKLSAWVQAFAKHDCQLEQYVEQYTGAGKNEMTRLVRHYQQVVDVQPLLETIKQQLIQDVCQCLKPDAEIIVATIASSPPVSRHNTGSKLATDLSPQASALQKQFMIDVLVDINMLDPMLALQPDKQTHSLDKTNTTHVQQQLTARLHKTLCGTVEQHLTLWVASQTGWTDKEVNSFINRPYLGHDPQKKLYKLAVSRIEKSINAFRSQPVKRLVTHNWQADKRVGILPVWGKKRRTNARSRIQPPNHPKHPI